ncbi:MAG: NAD-dependent epimerase/dehydratase family protein [Bacteroidota bacterium]
MGHEGFLQLLERRDLFDIIVLVLPTKRDRAIMSPYENEPGVTIVWGDLTSYDDVRRCVEHADFVLHVGGMVSPYADHYPELTTRVNLGAIRNILQAIKARPDRDEVRLVYIGTVAETGHRNPPVHWGRTGDPIKISYYDNYALTKTIAEREVAESGLRYWVSLRQTGILYPEILAGRDPIMYHVPVEGVFEWVTARDSGTLLAKVCTEQLPERFWRRFYNIGGGEKYRVTNYEFMQKSFGAFGIRDAKKVTELNWFATHNFHGQWYEDSDILEEYLHFRSGTFENFIGEMTAKAPSWTRLVRRLPPFLIRHFYLGPIARGKGGTLHWIRHKETEKIAAYFGSPEQWKRIPSWKNYSLPEPSRVPLRLDHGYDENKPEGELELGDVRQAAAFRGGECLSAEMGRGDLYTRLRWRCAFGHEFEATPALILLAGHWCPDCLPAPWNYDEEARHNPFFAQVWKPFL